MKYATIETRHGALRHVRVTETLQEEEDGLRGAPWGAAMLFSHSGPVSMVGMDRPLWLVWLRPAPGLGREAFTVQEIFLALPNTFANGVQGTRLLEVPLEWGRWFVHGGTVRVFGLS